MISNLNPNHQAKIHHFYHKKWSGIMVLSDVFLGGVTTVVIGGNSGNLVAKFTMSLQIKNRPISDNYLEKHRPQH